MGVGSRPPTRTRRRMGLSQATPPARDKARVGGARVVREGTAPARDPLAAVLQAVGLPLAVDPQERRAGRARALVVQATRRRARGPEPSPKRSTFETNATWRPSETSGASKGAS